MNVICVSGGNDSVALLQWAIKHELQNVSVLYNDTGWAAPFWRERVAQIEVFCSANGFLFSKTKSEGFAAMVKRKKGFPMAASRMQFCSNILKKEPTLKWLNKHDPFKKATVYIGIRREESLNRSHHPYEVIGDAKYGGRLQKFPLVEYTEKDRDFLIEETGLDILLHGSMECFPCVNANRNDLRLLSKYPERVQEIEDLEKNLGFTKKGGPKVMFRPYRHMGAIGIKNVLKWAQSERGKYRP